MKAKIAKSHRILNLPQLHIASFYKIGPFWVSARITQIAEIDACRPILRIRGATWVWGFHIYFTILGSPKYENCNGRCLVCLFLRIWGTPNWLIFLSLDHFGASRRTTKISKQSGCLYRNLPTRLQKASQKLHSIGLCTCCPLRASQKHVTKPNLQNESNKCKKDRSPPKTLPKPRTRPEPFSI